MLLEIAVSVPDEINIPFTVLPALLPSILPILFLTILWSLPAVIASPVTTDAPVEVNPVIVFPEKVCLPDVEVIPVIAPPPVTLL